MSLTAGTRIGSYEVLSSLGAGGMGQGRYEVGFLVPGLRFYDVSPDGQRFLMVKSDTQAAPRQLRLVVNWFEELKRLVPVK